ncbi:bifunctional phosphopantothenoylcysteine decarboxylase/phosphopantothenate--cysteine ligase CoaBC [Tumidithrix elongata RA019]|uniref:Coenzyme A biosynthesis bifunctional protein CoaBC n=1 Tax=Tumidithrix elongata BACA0141 TaxID=2716417 RepID=A0AAW9Q2P4_9CYAN|nr:bifunctional phosphopantothenoylcysteine decarboxylase/phosphopantothenate--cysteine ligase CoaBC [Tumidithrix elongata RA019]
MANRVLIGVTGGIAAYKVCEVVSTLAKAGIDVRVILTKSAEEFVTPLTFATLSRSPAYTDRDFWQPVHGRPLHIELGEWANVLAIAPLTANTMSHLAWGMADNLLTNTVLASQCPVLLAPAMNTTMWLQETVQQNWQKLQTNSRYWAIAPTSGILACDAVGTGRMAEPEAIVSYLESLLYTKGKRDLSGKRVLVSAGGTREFLDPVRFIGNPATGKQGIEIAKAAWHRGAEVTLVAAGNASIPNQPGIRVISVNSSAEMHQAMLEAFPQADLTIMAAAVGDVRPATYSDRKIPKAELPTSLALEAIADIVADLGKRKRSDQILVGFAAQTGTEAEILAAAQQKLVNKGLDAIAANAVDQSQMGFGTATNQATFIHKSGRQATTSLCSKLQLAHQLLDFLGNS